MPNTIAATVAVLEAAITTLSRSDQIILALFYDEDLTRREIGAILDMPEQTVVQRHALALTRLQEAAAQRSA